MTEAEWQACEDQGMMLTSLRGMASDRKLRLFACACWRRNEDLLPSPRGAEAVRVAELYADGLAGEGSLARHREVGLGVALGTGPTAAVRALEAVGLRAYRNLLRVAGSSWARRGAELERQRRELGRQRRMGCDQLLREIVGNPFRPVTADPAWLAWNNSTLPKLARAIYDEREFDRLPVLADALEDAGCADTDLLAHCRQGGEHVRGCWAVDLLLGKE